MSDTGTPPEIPKALQQYNSYAVDPRYQVNFTIAWTIILSITVIIGLPHFVRGRKKWTGTIVGVLEGWKDPCDLQESDNGKTLQLEAKKEETCCRRRQSPLPDKKYSAWKRAVAKISASTDAVLSWTPHYAGAHNLGQFILITSYLTAVLTCTAISAPLTTNANRAGFLALAQFPPLFLFSSKSSPLSLLNLLPSYIRLNILHRWAARGVFMCVVIHSTCWIAQHRRWGIPILGKQKEMTGIAAFGVLGTMILASLRLVRERMWVLFYWVHFLGFPVFFIIVCYHTPYASPWIFAPIAIYAFDLVWRSIRMRAKDAYLVRVDDDFTIVHIPYCDRGFHGGQHLRLRVFFDGWGIFESHPLSIMCAPSALSCIHICDISAYWDASVDSSIQESEAKNLRVEEFQEVQEQPPDGKWDKDTAGIVLGARVAGDWTAALNKWAKDQEQWRQGSSSDQPKAGIVNLSRLPGLPLHVQVMFDGPYGGCELELGTFDRVLLIAGGSGVTFATGILDEIVGTSLPKRIKAGQIAAEVTQRVTRVDFVWCIRSIGSVKWITPLLSAIARENGRHSRLQLRFLVYVTCLCSTEDVPRIPGMDVRVGGRPDIDKLLNEIVDLEPEAGFHVQGDGLKGHVEGDEYCACGCLDQALENQKRDEGDDAEKAMSKHERFEGRVAVLASGPASMTKDVANAVTAFTLKNGGDGIEFGLHAEVFAF